MSSTQNKTAIIIGATGLVGNQLLDLLLTHPRYEKVKVFHRRSTGVIHQRLEEHIIDFEELSSWKHLLTGDDLYSALGTTLEAAGSEEAQYQVDFHYQHDVARAAFEQGVEQFALISSLGADSTSRFFYPKMKGQLDEAVQKIGFEQLVIMRPSFLKGNRKSARFWESVGIKVADFFSFIPGLRKYKPIKARELARATIAAIHRPENNQIYSGRDIFSLLS